MCVSATPAVRLFQLPKFSKIFEKNLVELGSGVKFLHEAPNKSSARQSNATAKFLSKKQPKITA